eukprot:6200197-Pleurochrysis_carterae.AAC.5
MDLLRSCPCSLPSHAQSRRPRTPSAVTRAATSHSMGAADEGEPRSRAPACDAARPERTRSHGAHWLSMMKRGAYNIGPGAHALRTGAAGHRHGTGGGDGANM